MPASGSAPGNPDAPGADAPSPTVLFLCTGNAARSVMAGVALAALATTVGVETAGTLTVEGQPASWRTRAALASIGLDVGRHRSRQATGSHLDSVAVIIALAPEHVAWVRREHPGAAARAVTLKRLVRDLPAGGPLPARIDALDLGAVGLEDWEEVVDPGGGDLPEFTACATEIAGLIRALAPRLG